MGDTARAKHEGQPSASVAAAQAAEQLTRMLSSISEVIYEVVVPDAPSSAHVVYVSPQVEHILGYRPEEFMRDPTLWSRLMHPDDVAAVQETDRSLWQQREPLVRQYRLQHKTTHQYRWIEDRTVPRLDAEGRFIGIYGAARDITKRKLAEEALRASDERFRALVEHSAEAITLLDAHGAVVYVSQSAVPVLGYGTEETLARRGFQLVHPDDLQAAKALFRELLERPGHVVRAEVRARHKSGSWRHLEAVGVNRLHEPAVGAIVVNYHDITERKQLEEERRTFLIRVISAQEDERRRVARELHDESGQALTSLLVRLRAIEDAGSLRGVKATVRRMRRLVAGAIDGIGRLARGLHPAVLDDLGLRAAVSRFAAEVTEVHGVAVKLDTRGLTASRLPRPVELTLYRIAQEALTNAMTHAGAKHVRMSLRRTKTAVRLTVQDDGCGFDLGSALRESVSTGHLGLHSMRERAALLGGAVTVDSRLLEGTTVSARIPLPSPKVSRAAPRKAARSRSTR